MADCLSVELRDLAQRFGRRTVYTGVTACASAGEVLVVTGPNGSGKSTLLRVAAGLLTPTAGTVQVRHGEHVLDRQALRPYVGLVAPDLHLYSDMTGVENLLFFGALRGLRLTRDDLAGLLERVGLKGRGRDLVGAYSSGMRQRLKYAFALTHRPPILLLDEPTANLDADGARMARTVVTEQRARGLVIMATNERDEVEWGDRVIRLGRD